LPLRRLAAYRQSSDVKNTAKRRVLSLLYALLYTRQAVSP
jgi:hypothetical protein